MSDFLGPYAQYSAKSFIKKDKMPLNEWIIGDYLFNGIDSN